MRHSVVDTLVGVAAAECSHGYSFYRRIDSVKGRNLGQIHRTRVRS